MNKLTVPQKHQLAIALRTLKMSKVGAQCAGGMSHKEAVSFLKSIGYDANKIVHILCAAGHPAEDIQEFLS